MRGLARKKAAVVPIESARRRLRPGTETTRVTPAGVSQGKLALAVATVVALSACVLGVKLSLGYVQHNNLLMAVLVPWWIVLPGCAPLVVLLVFRHGARPLPRAPIRRLGAYRRATTRRRAP